MNAQDVVTKPIWRFHLVWAFFGLSEDNKEYVYEEIFQLIHYGSWSFREAYNLPVLIRKWFIQRIAAEKKSEAEARSQWAQ